MSPGTIFVTVCLAAAVLFGALGLLTSPTAKYETVDLVRTRTRTALFSCAVICLGGAFYAWFFIDG